MVVDDDDPEDPEATVVYSDDPLYVIETDQGLYIQHIDAESGVGVSWDGMGMELVGGFT